MEKLCLITMHCIFIFSMLKVIFTEFLECYTKVVNLLNSWGIGKEEKMERKDGEMEKSVKLYIIEY